MERTGVCKADGPFGMQYPCSQRLVPCGAQSVPLGDGPWFSMVGRVWITMEEQEVAKEEWGLSLLLLLLFWFFFSFFSCFPMTPSDRRDLRCKITHEGAEVCLEGLLFPGAPGILLDDHHGHCSYSGWSEISALTPSGQVVSLWFSRPHSLPVVWINAVPGDVDTCWPDPWGQVTLRRWVLLTWGELEWLTQRQKAWYPVTNPLIQPNPHLFPPTPSFFFFLKFILKEHLLHQLLEYLNCIMSTGPSQTDILY